MIKYSIIIATYNRYTSLEKLLNLLSKQNTNESFEVIVIDQSDNHKSIGGSLNLNNLVHIKTEVKGLSLSRNVGIESAKGKYVLIMDDDVIIDNNYMQNLDDIIESRNSDIICGKISNIEDKLPYSRYMGDEEKIVNSRNYNICLSATLCFKREDLLNIGLFDVDFGVAAKYGGSEETDIILRMLWDKKKITYVPSHIVYHPKYDHSLISFSDILNKSYAYGIGRGAVYRKHMKKKFIWAGKELLISLIKSSIGLFGSMVVLDFNGVTRYLATLSGRIVGFTIYSSSNN